MPGALIYFYLTQSKARFIRYFIIVCLIFFLVLPTFKAILAERYNARMEQMENIENEARYKEFFYVMREFREGNVSQKLFGREVFNTGQFFGRSIFIKPDDTWRPVIFSLWVRSYRAAAVSLGIFVAFYGRQALQAAVDKTSGIQGALCHIFCSSAVNVPDIYVRQRYHRRKMYGFSVTGSHNRIGQDEGKSNNQKPGLKNGGLSSCI